MTPDPLATVHAALTDRRQTVSELWFTYGMDRAVIEEALAELERKGLAKRGESMGVEVWTTHGEPPRMDTWTRRETK